MTVRLQRTPGGAVGEVIGPVATGYRSSPDGSLSPSAPGPVNAPLSADEALAIGCALANRYDLTVVVIDDDEVWPARWGVLEPAA